MKKAGEPRGNYPSESLADGAAIRFISGMLLTALLADSLALGPHWIYDRADLAARFPSLESLEPPATQYHPGKQAGDQTHLGDQTLILADSLLATKGEPDAGHFLAQWTAFWNDPKTQSYRDKATKFVLENGSPSSSTELAGAARTAPLAAILLKRGVRGDRLAEQLYAHVSLTHRSEASQQATNVLAQLLSQVADGKPLLDVLPADPHPTLETGAAIEELGQGCNITGALPASLLLLRRHGAEPKAALQQNALAGGDSAARGLFIGMILGIQRPKLPESWAAQLHARFTVERFERES